MEILRNKELSEEMARLLPYLEVTHYTNGAQAICNLTNNGCLQMRRKSCSSILTNKGYEITAIYPQPDGCGKCPINLNRTT